MIVAKIRHRSRRRNHRRQIALCPSTNWIIGAPAIALAAIAAPLAQLKTEPRHPNVAAQLGQLTRALPAPFLTTSGLAILHFAPLPIFRDRCIDPPNVCSARLERSGFTFAHVRRKAPPLPSPWRLPARIVVGPTPMRRARPTDRHRAGAATAPSRKIAARIQRTPPSPFAASIR